jgi:hypothetical protein
VSSGLIYAVIVGLWAVVLVPVWLRRHDEVVESRSVDRFQGAMRTLSRRGPGGDRREVLVPRRGATRAVPDGAAARLSAATVAAARRRRIGLVLTVLTVLLAVLGAVGVLRWWAALVPLGLLVLFGLTVRMGARRARARELAARRARAARARRERREAMADVASPAYVAPLGRVARDELFDQAAPDAMVAASPPEPVAPAAAVAAVPEPAEFYDAVAQRVWDPVPVPLPTYVLAPKAPRSVRVIDLTRPGAWTSGHLDESVHDEEAAEAAAVAEAYEAAQQPRDGIVTGEVLVERRRAVGD